jgi:hypothetical protein
LKFVRNTFYMSNGKNILLERNCFSAFGNSDKLKTFRVASVASLAMIPVFLQLRLSI